MSQQSRIASPVAHLLLVALSLAAIALAPLPAARAWIIVLAVQIALIWNMWRFAQDAAITRKLVSCVPIMAGAAIAMQFWPYQLSVPVELSALPVAMALAAAMVGFFGLNLYRSRAFFAEPELVEFVQPHMNKPLARAEIVHMLVAPAAEELMFRAFPATFFTDLPSYAVFSISTFILVHYINPWSARKINPLGLLEQVAMAALLTLIFLGFGLGWAILAHTLYNLTARSFYAAYLIRT